MRRRRQSAVYSPGGCGCGLLLLPVIAVSIGVMFALAGLAAAALVLLIVAIGVTIWLCRNREQNQCRLGRLSDHCVPAECQLPCFLCPVDDQCLYRGIRHGGLITAGRRSRKVRLLGVWITALAVYRNLSSQLMNSSSILPTMCCVPAR